MALITRTFVVSWGATGQTLFFTIYDSNKNVIVPRTNNGVEEWPPLSGFYQTTFDNNFDTTWVGSIVWDDGAGNYAEDDLENTQVVAPVPPTPPIPPISPDITDERTAGIIQNYLYPMLGIFMRLQVWDEKMAVLDPTIGSVQSTYGNWIAPASVQIYRNEDQLLINGVDYTVSDQVNGIVGITVPSTMVGSDFFCSYMFRYFTDAELQSFCNLGLQIINASSTAMTHVTAYTTVDSSPGYWDGPITLWAYACCLERLLLDSLIWKPYLIYQDGAAAQGILEAELAASKAAFTELAQSVKNVHYIHKVTMAYEAFALSGIGSFGIGNRLRGFRSNRYGIPANAGWTNAGGL